MAPPCTQLKKVLSSIPEAPLSVECLMNDIDFRSSMTREKMEELAAPILERMRAPLAKVAHTMLHVTTMKLTTSVTIILAAVLSLKVASRPAGA